MVCRPLCRRAHFDAFAWWLPHPSCDDVSHDRTSCARIAQWEPIVFCRIFTLLAFTNRLHFWISSHGVPLSFLTWEKLRNKLAVYQAYYLKGATWKATFL